MSDETPIKIAIDLFGSEAKLASAIGVSQNAVNKAKHRVLNGYAVSAEMALKIERATSGKVSKSTLRPDLWPLSEVA